MCTLWSVYAQTQQSLSGWPAVWKEGTHLSTCPESECEHGLCRATPSLVLGWAVLDPTFRTSYLSCCHSAALPIGGKHPFRRSSPPCHMPLLPPPRHYPGMNPQVPSSFPVCPLLLGWPALMQVWSAFQTACQLPIGGLLRCHSLLGSFRTQCVMAPAQGCNPLGGLSLCPPCLLLPDTWNLHILVAVT